MIVIHILYPKERFHSFVSAQLLISYNSSHVTQYVTSHHKVSTVYFNQVFPTPYINQ